MIVRRALPSDLPAIVRVHQSAFPGFFLTEMGPAFLRAYYQAVLNYESSICLVAEVDSQLAGFAVGALAPSRFYQVMSRSKRRMLVPIALGVLRNPRLIGRVVLNMSRVSSADQPQQTSSDDVCELTSIGVESGQSGNGIGQALMLEFIQKAKNLHASMIILTTDAEGNDAVNRFYQKQCFVLHRQFHRTKTRLMNEYVLELTGTASCVLPRQKDNQ